MNLFQEHLEFMRLKASIKLEKGNGYLFKLNKLKPKGFPDDFKVYFEEFNYYYGGEDHIIKVEDSLIESNISIPDKEIYKEDLYEATFSGNFYFDISDEKYHDLIESNECEGIDYTIYIYSKDKKIKLYSDDDWEFFGNSNTELFNIESVNN